jgi:hypothetical protein
MKPRLSQFVSSVCCALILGCNSGVKPPTMKPADVQSLVLYDVDLREVPNYSNLLTNVSSQPLKAEEVRLMFANTTDESLHIWKGALLGVAQCKDGTKYHLAISHFGGFARVLETGQSMRFVGASGTELERIKSAALRDVFIPARQQKNQAEGR